MDFSQSSLLILAVSAVVALILLVLLITIIVMLARRGAGKGNAGAEPEERFAALGEQMLALQQRLDTQRQHFKEIDTAIARVDGLIREELGRNREEMTRQQQATREETTKTLLDSRASTEQTLLTTREETVKALRENREEMNRQFTDIRETIEIRLTTIQNDNASKLEEMRRTVDEKLQETVEKRFSESFNLISERLEQVHKGLGEMQTLANGVGDLKKVLSNVKTRGNLGEYQLGAILEQVLSPEQYLTNAQTKKRSQERVEFAIKLPGRGDDDSNELLLPIDSKFPVEDYERLLNAYEGLGTEAPDVIAKRLEISLKRFARDIRDKYINPPLTTDFAILFVPTEGLYAEVLRVPGLFDTLQRDFRVTVVGPTNLVAFLSSLQMGFRTLAVEKRSSEVWKLLGSVKAEFGKFADVLERVKKKLEVASNEITNVGTRTRAITRQLNKVQELPSSDNSETEVLLLSDISDGETEVPLDTPEGEAETPPAAEPPIELITESP